MLSQKFENTFLKYSGLSSIYYVCSYHMESIAVRVAHMNFRHYWRFIQIKPQWHLARVNVFLQVLSDKCSSQSYVWEHFRIWFSIQLHEKQGCVAMRDRRFFFQQYWLTVWGETACSTENWLSFYPPLRQDICFIFQNFKHWKILYNTQNLECS